MSGTQTVRGRSVRVNASFVDILERSDTLVGLMGNVEARNGRFALYGDVVWSSIGFKRDGVRARAPAPGVTAAVSRTFNLDIQMAIAEVGASYEIARVGDLGLDVLGGVRYWHQEADLSFAADLTAAVGDLAWVNGRAFARSGSVDWLDPLIGGRVRYAVAPGHELFMRGDIGGFGLGSEFSWQAMGGYGFDFDTYDGVTISGVIGYRALSVNYTQGAGHRRYEFDMVQHGPVLGLSLRY
ncbi:hypothetical protein [Microvirga pudoricolor]|uniref:hypothetical protein n=1 Tax=Microvirga pudoricolor TaxID=2778729 RepID=UPI0019527A51|nr:hypothetical protein [Microvirga pudoricolor]MBM6594362.1 hypothetical protein [Microvirga pudoricolor]